jgi:hypothetical protein
VSAKGPQELLREAAEAALTAARKLAWAREALSRGYLKEAVRSMGEARGELRRSLSLVKRASAALKRAREEPPLG